MNGSSTEEAITKDRRLTEFDILDIVRGRALATAAAHKASLATTAAHKKTVAGLDGRTSQEMILSEEEDFIEETAPPMNPVAPQPGVRGRESESCNGMTEKEIKYKQKSKELGSHCAGAYVKDSNSSSSPAGSASTPAALNTVSRTPNQVANSIAISHQEGSLLDDAGGNVNEIESAFSPGARAGSVFVPIGVTKVTRGLRRTPMDWEAKVADARQERAPERRNQLLKAVDGAHDSDYITTTHDSSVASSWVEKLVMANPVAEEEEGSNNKNNNNTAAFVDAAGVDNSTSQASPAGSDDAAFATTAACRQTKRMPRADELATTTIQENTEDRSKILSHRSRHAPRSSSSSSQGAENTSRRTTRHCGSKPSASSEEGMNTSHGSGGVSSSSSAPIEQKTHISRDRTAATSLHRCPNLKSTSDHPHISIPGGSRVAGLDGSTSQEMNLSEEEDFIEERDAVVLPASMENWSSSNLETPSSFMIRAFAVDEEKAEEEMRQKIFQQAVSARSVRRMVTDDSNYHKGGIFAWRNKLIAGFFLFLLLLAIALLLSLLLLTRKSGEEVDKEKHSTRQRFGPTLHRVRQRGYLNCGMGRINSSLYYFDENGERSGLNVAWCKALAAAANVNATYVTVNSKDRFHSLMNDTIDVMYGATDTMERRIHEASTGIGFSFSTPYLHEGLRIAGDPFTVSCVENEKQWSEECSRFKVCVKAGTSHLDALLQILPKRQLEIAEDLEAMVQSLMDKRCHAIAGEGHVLQEKSVRDYGYRGSFSVGTRIFSKEPLCFLTRGGDPEWAAFAESVLQALLLAEKHGITRSNAMLFPETAAFGDGYRRMHAHAIGAGGNYGELYSKFVEPVIPRSAINVINDHTQGPAGLMFSHPFGKAGVIGVGSSYLDSIVSRGQVRCAMTVKNPGFATYLPDSDEFEGLEVEICKALSVALFEGDPTRFTIVAVDDPSDGYASLGADSDVFVGATWNYQALTKEKVNGNGYAFSVPYFYKNSRDDNEEDNRSVATSAQDHTWSSFVYLAVTGLIYAEEEGINKENGNAMPEVNLFGPRYSRMLKDLVLAQGNYEHLYNMTLAKTVPRVGRNQINSLLSPGPQLYTIPGLLEE